METVEITVKLPADMVNSFFSLLSDLKKYKNTLYSQSADSLTGEESSEPNGEETGIADIETSIEESKEEKKKEEKKREKKSRPENVEEIKDYIRENGLTIDPQKFWSYYEKRNWIDGKGEKIQDWTAIADSWEKREWRRKTVRTAPTKVVNDIDRVYEKLKKEKDDVFLLEPGTGN